MSDWFDRATCRQVGLTIWDYDAAKEDHEMAIDICWNQCPVQQQCADYADRLQPDGGIWAGEHRERHTSREAAGVA